MLDVPRELIRFTAGLLRTERKARGTRKGTRALTCWALAARAPDLHQALQHALDTGLTHLELDGKIFSADRCRITILSTKGKPIDEWCSGKAHQHGGNIQALSEADGFPIFTSDVEPGHIHAIDAARVHILPMLYPHTGQLPVLADPGYQGAGHGVIVPIAAPTGSNVLAIDNRCRNHLQRFLRCRAERGFALLTERWQALQHTSLSPSRIGDLVRAARVLTLFEPGSTESH
ncbi:transposase family protein [Actinomadura chokoriensis]|uniref:Transposase family protein n=2 Tax=Actinomadura chokoriensis TaxID=454156 RepID=A0ABV4QWE5_9ACTN